MKIAIIGSGISGLTCGYYLHNDHDITVYESNDYIGGHTATIDIEQDDTTYAVDTGFIVYNDRTYPNFIRLLNELGVTSQPTQMSFSVRNDANGLEYNGHTLSTLFAQKKNLINPTFYKFIADILRFNRLAKCQVNKSSSQQATLGEFLEKHGFNAYFCTNYILPMGAAIWSSTLADMRGFPLQFFLRFFLNHGLLDITNRPQWYVIKGGSRSYIAPLTQGFYDRIHLNAPVQMVTRTPQGVLLQVNGKTEPFDLVIFACHSDQAMALLHDNITPQEQEILGKLHYQPNDVVLHLDDTLLPKSTRAWAAWNYRMINPSQEQNHQPMLTYNMNILQHLPSRQTFCVTLNSTEHINPKRILNTFVYHHPIFTSESIEAQNQRNSINGKNATWFCGAYWYNGFHEDGVRSALDVITGINAITAKHTKMGAA